MAPRAAVRPGPRRRGRPQGTSGARESILEAARHAFATRGYQGTTIRRVATAAGVDPALVHHYFGTKAGLFRAAIHLPFDAAAVIPAILAGDPAAVGERLAAFLVGLLDDPDAGGRVLSMLRAAASHEEAADALRSLIEREVLGPLARSLDRDRPELRAALVGSQVVGLAMARRVVGVEPLVSADRATVVAAIGPTFQRYLTGDLEAAGPPGAAR